MSRSSQLKQPNDVPQNMYAMTMAAAKKNVTKFFIFLTIFSYFFFKLENKPNNKMLLKLIVVVELIYGYNLKL